jgi:hypothetical protein
VPNSQPFQARLAKKQIRKAGDLPALIRTLWHAIVEAREILDTTESEDTKLRAVHAIGQTAATYARLLEVGEHEARLVAVEEALRGRIA